MCAWERVCVCVPRRVGLLLIEVNAGHAGPGEGIAIKELCKKLGHIAKLVSLKPMYSTILCVC